MTDQGYINVGVDVDQQSFAQLNASVNTSAQQLTRLTQANDAVSQSADVASDKLRNAFASMKGSIDADVASINQLRSQLTGAADDASKVQQKSSGGSGGSGVSGLRRTGSALTQLGLGEIGRPVQILGDVQQVVKEFDQLGNVVKAAIPALGALDAGLVGVVAALAPIAVIAGAVAIGIKLYNDGLSQSSKELGKATAALDTYYKTIANGTTESIQKQKDALTQQKALLDAQVKNIQDSLDHAFKATSGEFGGDPLARVKFAIAGLTDENFKNLQTRLGDLKKQSSDLDGQLQGLGTAMDSAAVKANDYAEAILKQADLTAQNQIESWKMIREGTSKQIQGILDDNRSKLQAYTQELATLKGIQNPTEDVKKKIADLTDEMAALNLQSNTLTQNVLPLVEAREKETAAIERASKAVTDHADAVKKQEESQVSIVDKYNKDVQSAEDTAAQARLDANQKLQDALVNAAQKAVDDANKALEQLEQKRAENLLSYQRDTAKSDREANDQIISDQIKAQRQERDDLQTHLDNLKAIRDRDAGRERDDLLNRNYRDLFALQEQKKQDIGTEDNRYTQQQQQRQQALQDEESDQARSIAVQRRERLIAYQQANQDAQRQYVQELAQAELAKQKAITQAQQSYQRELSLLSANLTKKEALLRQDAINELKLTQQTEDQKMAIFNQKLAQVNQLLGDSSQSINGGSSYISHGQSRVVAMASGGNVSAYDSVIVNDGGRRESFNNSMFPQGLGLFTPMQSGYVNSGGSTSKAASGQNNNTFYITSQDPQGVRREVISALKGIITR